MLKLHFLQYHLDFFPGKYGSRLYAHDAGWLLLDACSRDTNRKIEEKKDDKTKCSWYIYLFLLSTMYVDNIHTFWTLYSNFKNVLIFFFFFNKNVVVDFKPFSLHNGGW
jgi:hypothetical protein